MVDYIYVYDERETRPYQGGARVERGQALGRDCQRQGIGTVLYETGALWMHERGLRLHASGLQSDEAIGAWSALRGRGLVRPVKGATRTRQVFDVEPLLAEHPELFPVLAVPESGSSSPASR